MRGARLRAASSGDERGKLGWAQPALESVNYKPISVKTPWTDHLAWLGAGLAIPCLRP